MQYRCVANKTCVNNRDPTRNILCSENFLIPRNTAYPPCKFYSTIHRRFSERLFIVEDCTVTFLTYFIIVSRIRSEGSRAYDLSAPYRVPGRKMSWQGTRYTCISPFHHTPVKTAISYRFVRREVPRSNGVEKTRKWLEPIKSLSNANNVIFSSLCMYCKLNQDPTRMYTRFPIDRVKSYLI